MGNVRSGKLIYAIALTIVFYAGLAYSATSKTANSPKTSESRRVVPNRWETYMTNYGSLIDRNGGGIWPVGTSHKYVFAAGIWVGAQTSSIWPGKTRDTLVSFGYDFSMGVSEYTPSAISGDTIDDATAKLYLSTDTGWPLIKNGGGDSIVSSVDTYTKYDDWDLASIQWGRPLKIKVSQTSYGWTMGNTKDVIYYIYEVKNTSGDTLWDVYLGSAFDNDIGDATNDRVTFKQERNLGIQYQTEPEAGWDTTGVVGVRVFETPVCTKASVSVIDNQYPKTITRGQPLGVTAFKLSALGNDPYSDIQKYVMMQGYNYQTMVLDAYDENGGLVAEDKRFVMCTGPFDMPPDTTVRFVIGVIAATDTLALMTVSDHAQQAYDNSFSSLPILVTSPTTAQAVSGVINITWSCAVTCTTDVYCSPDEGETWTLIAANQPGSGLYPWNTTMVPDGVKYKVGIYAHNGINYGFDASDQLFTINNTGDIAPQYEILDYTSPWSGTEYLKFMLGDADNDQLTKTLYIQRFGWDTTRWDKVATSQGDLQLWSRDSLAWNTTVYPNGSYGMLLTINDGTNAVAETMDYYHGHDGHGMVLLQNDFPATDSATQTDGTTKFITPSPYVINPALLTGHNYEYRFRPISGRKIYWDYQYYTLSYDLWDTDLDTMLLNNGRFSCYIPYYYYPNERYWSPAIPDQIDGFVPEVRWQEQALFMEGQHGDSLKITNNAGNVSLDTLNVFPADTNLSETPKWMFRGCDYEIRWHVRGTYPNDTLTAEVWDMDNNVIVPLDTTAFDSLTQSAWSFGATATESGRSIITNAITTSARKYIFICGTRCMFNNGSTALDMTWVTHPSEGEIWRLYTHGVKPPREGDVYRFKGVTGVEGAPSEIAPTSLLLHQNAPNPFKQMTTINYQLAKPGLVNLKVYNIAGQLVKTLASVQEGAGPHTIKWDGRDGQGNKVSSGIYIYRLQAENKDVTRKLVILR